MRVEQLTHTIIALGEGPVWNGEAGKLFYTDITGCTLYEYDPVSEENRVYWKGNMQVGGFAFARSGGCVLCTDRGIFLLDENGSTGENMFPSLVLRQGERFNDITTGPCGRIYGGTMYRHLGENDGILYRLEKGKDPVKLLEGLGTSNGMSFTMDEKTFFHTDSRQRTITSYDYNRFTGDIEHPRTFFAGEEQWGSPDGHTIDTDDTLWVAFWGGSCIRKVDNTGSVIDKIDTPAGQTSSVMFGGEDLTDLYITSASSGALNSESGMDKEGNFLGGYLYRIRNAGQGRAEWKAGF